MRDVQAKSRLIAQEYGLRGFVMAPSRLHLLERGLSVPTIFRLHSLSTIYGISVQELFSIYGLKLSGGLHAGTK